MSAARAAPPPITLPRRRRSPHGWTPVDPVRRPVLLINPRSGGGRATQTAIAERARERGVEALCSTADRSLAALAAVALADGADALGVAGGDGSLAIVAAAARAHDVPFVCIPAGTRNHFARDLGVDVHDLTGALDAFADGVERRIDVAEVNGRMFLNNVSLGVYGEAVRRPAYRDAKARILLATLDEVLSSRAELPGLRVVDDRGREHAYPVVVLVSNNPYAVGAVAPGTRPRLDGGRLGIFVLDPPAAPPQLLWRAWSAPRFDVAAAAPLHAGIDGEAVELGADLHFAVRPASLRVRIAARHARPAVPRLR